jgi:hypothetical protein
MSNSERHTNRLIAFAKVWKNRVDRKDRASAERADSILRLLAGKTIPEKHQDVTSCVLVKLLEKLDSNPAAADTELMRTAESALRMERHAEALARGVQRDQSADAEGSIRVTITSVEDSMVDDVSKNYELVDTSFAGADPMEQLIALDMVKEELAKLDPRVAKKYRRQLKLCSMVHIRVRGDEYAGDRTHERRLRDFLNHYSEYPITPEARDLAEEILDGMEGRPVSDLAYNACEALLVKCHSTYELNFAPLARTFHQSINQGSLK